LWVGLRYAVYTGVILGFTASLPLIARGGDGLRAFTDGGPVEWGQFWLLVVITLANVVAGVRFRAFREVFLLLAAAAGFATVREMDYLLDRLVPALGWQIGFVLPVAAGVLAARAGDRFWAQMRVFVRTGAFVTLWAGLMIAIPVGQLVGHGELLELLMGEDYDHHYKHAIEEMLESTGYLVLGMGTAEAWLWAGAEEEKAL
jgi:hypothetical protein